MSHKVIIILDPSDGVNDRLTGMEPCSLAEVKRIKTMIEIIVVNGS